MGIKKTTTKICTCDLCYKECNEEDANVSVDVSIAMRDIGATKVFARFLPIIPYAPASANIICRSCLISALRKWLKENDKQMHPPAKLCA